MLPFELSLTCCQVYFNLNDEQGSKLASAEIDRYMKDPRVAVQEINFPFKGRKLCLPFLKLLILLVIIFLIIIVLNLLIVSYSLTHM